MAVAVHNNEGTKLAENTKQDALIESKKKLVSTVAVLGSAILLNQNENYQKMNLVLIGAVCTVVAVTKITEKFLEFTSGLNNDLAEVGC